MHYVRNHGHVPLLHWETHTLLVYAESSVPVDLKRREYTMEELTGTKFKDSMIEIPVTMGCDGSKRVLPGNIENNIDFFSPHRPPEGSEHGQTNEGVRLVRVGRFDGHMAWCSHYRSTS